MSSAIVDRGEAEEDERLPDDVMSQNRLRKLCHPAKKIYVLFFFDNDAEILWNKAFSSDKTKENERSSKKEHM